MQDLRSHDADRARALLQTTWKQESAGDRAKFLDVLRVGLSRADEPFLEGLLSNSAKGTPNERSKDVRRIATDLLASLPDSNLCQQISAHIPRYVSFIKGQQPALKVELPTALDSPLIQAAIESNPTKAAPHLGEKAWWLLQLIGATPLSIWSRWEMPPVELVRSVKNHGWEAVLLDGWALAAKRQQNSEWIEALLNQWITGKNAVRTTAVPDLSIENLWYVLSCDRQDAFLRHFLESGQGAIGDSLTIWLLRHSRQVWSLELAQMILDRLATHLPKNGTPNHWIWELSSALKEFACFMPVSLLANAAALRTQLAEKSPWIHSVEEFLTLLQFREEMMQAFGVGSWND